ncbi:MAG: ATP-binding protein [Christensenellales bacterium]|jgi:signal transduction histidine kinase
MIKSGLFLRTLTLVMATILLSAVLIMALFVPLSRRQISSIRATELELKANYLADEYVRYNRGLQSHESFRLRVGSNSAWGASAMVFKYDGTLDVYTIPNDTEEGTPERQQAMAAAQAFAATLSDYVTTVLAVGESITVVDTSGSGAGHLIVGVPAHIAGITIGAVFLAKPMADVNTPSSDLAVALMLCMALALLMMLIPSFYATRFLIKPINQMRDVALAMAGGDFTVRANDSQRDEIGQLGGALNYLSSRLSSTIGALVVERNRLERILNGLSEGIVAVGKDGEITHANPAVFRLFGADPQAVSDRMAFIPDASLWDDFDACVKDGVPILRSLISDSTIFLVNISPLEDEKRGVVGAVALFHDVTESERLEQTRRDYVANVSHELRTPVAAVRGLAEALSDGLVDEADKPRYYSHILRESMRLSRLIDDLLELSRLQTGAVALEKESFDVAELLRSFADCYSPRADAVGISFAVEIPSDLPFAISNADRVEQVLVILFDNAIKFTPEGGRIALSADFDGESIILSLSDTGCGIAKTDLPHVFDRFYKTDAAHSQSGTGLGLSIAQEIITLLGERIWVESKQGEGTTFRFTLKAEEHDADMTHPHDQLR